MKNSKGYKIFNFITKIISWCVMAILCVIGTFLVVYICVNKIAQAQGKSAPLGLYTIISPSMTPDIDVYDVVFVMKKDPNEIKVGDVVSYYSTNSFFGTTPITHRIVEKYINPSDGKPIFRTKGDANPVMDDEVIVSDNIIGTVRFVIPALGRIQFFLASKGGWFIAILVPALGIIIYDIMKLCKLIRVKKKMAYLEQISKEEKALKYNKKNKNLNIEKTNVSKNNITKKASIRK